jgi:hypothetical protein
MLRTEGKSAKPNDLFDLPGGKSAKIAHYVAQHLIGQLS